MTTLFELPEPAPTPTPADYSTPHWVRAYETQTGAAVRLSGGKAIPAPCPRCRRWCLTGYDAPLCALQAWVDPSPLTLALEGAAVVLGRTTYRLWGAAGRWELAWRIAPGTPVIGRPTPADACTVLAEHVCNSAPLSREPLNITTPKKYRDLSVIPF